jgi:hypothetical protein
MKPLKSKPNRDNEILWAKKARAELLKMMCDDSMSSNFDNLDIKKEEAIKLLQTNKKLITVKCLEFDKYGRLLVELYNNDTDIKSFNDILVEKELAVRYDGGTKKAPWIN